MTASLYQRRSVIRGHGIRAVSGVRAHGGLKRHARIVACRPQLAKQHRLVRMGADVVLQTPAATGLSSVVEFDAVSYAYSGVPVIDSVSLRIARGESLALVGRSGAGKSTILKLINRLLL